MSFDQRPKIIFCLSFPGLLISCGMCIKSLKHGYFMENLQRKAHAHAHAHAQQEEKDSYVFICLVKISMCFCIIIQNREVAWLEMKIIF